MRSAEVTTEGAEGCESIIAERLNGEVIVMRIYHFRRQTRVYAESCINLCVMFLIPITEGGFTFESSIILE